MNGNTENSLPIKPVKSRVFIVAYVRGLALIDMLLGTIAIMMIMGVLLTAISLQLTQVARLARNTRIYMLLDGEMEYLRSLSGPPFEACKQEHFTPVLGVPKAFSKVVFQKCVSLEENNRIARVVLTASFPGSEREHSPIVIERLIYVAPAGDSEDKGKSGS